ncbi:eukaryotic initiation factor 4F subunit p150 [Monosporozyma unispora]
MSQQDNPSQTSQDTSTMSQAEQTKKSFIEIVKARKAALEKRRLEEAEAAKKAQEDSTPVEQSTTTPVEVSKETQESQEPKEEKKVLTFAEKLRLKKQQKAQEEAAAAAAAVAAATSADSTETAATVESTPVIEESTTPATTTTEEVTKPVTTEESVEITESTPVTTEENDENQTTEENQPQITEEDLEGKMTVTKLLTRLSEVPPIEDIFTFKYPESLESPDIKYKKEHVKYTYGPTFLLQFKENCNVIADPEWIASTRSKIVIPPNMSRNNRSRGGDGSKFGSRNNTNDFRSNSSRGGDSRANSKRRSRRDRDDRRSNRNASRRDRSERKGGRGDRENDDKKKDDEPKIEVAPFVPSANRWVPKSRAKKETTEVEKKFASDGVTELFEKDEIERKMKSLLNKLTLEKFDPISADILALANLSKWETNGETLKTVIEQIFLKACDEPHWSSMYAQLCGKAVKDLDPEIVDETNEGVTGPKLVLHYLVVRCHTEFEKGWTDKLPTNEDGTPLSPEMMSDEYYKMAAAKRRGLGLVRFIGHLYRLNLLTGKMMFECFRRLMKDLNNQPSEEVLESVVELLSTVGEKFENDSFNAGPATLEGSALLDSLFGLLQQVIDGGEVSNRIKFKLLDMTELREKNWASDKKDQGPKTITQIHEEEELARALKQANSRSNSRRSNRNNSNRNSSRREGPPPNAKDKDNFTSTRSFSQRSQRTPQKEPEPAPALHTSASTNMFSALMDNNSDDE